MFNQFYYYFKFRKFNFYTFVNLVIDQFLKYFVWQNAQFIDNVERYKREMNSFKTIWVSN